MMTVSGCGEPSRVVRLPQHPSGACFATPSPRVSTCPVGGAGASGRHSRAPRGLLSALQSPW